MTSQKLQNFNLYFDHTALKPESTEKDVVKLCGEAKKYKFYSVCVNSSYISLAKRQLEGSEVRIASVVGFPLGACSTAAKVFETQQAVKDGASEIDMVIHVGALKESRKNYVRDDIKAVVDCCKGKADVKVILETCLLADDEITEACRISKEAGARFVKTSTGFSKEGATARIVKLMKDAVGDDMLVKASGGIRTLSDALEMIEAGADRIGASASVSIMEDYRGRKKEDV